MESETESSSLAVSLTSQDIEGVSSSDESHRDEGSSSSVSKDNRDKVVSVLSRLKAPRASDLARKRKVAVNPPKGKRGCRGATAAEPKNITALQRVKEFLDQPLCVLNRKLFCNACRQEMSLKMSSMRNHIRSTKHEESCRRLKSKEAREKSIADALAVHNEESHLKGETLPPNQQVYRVRVLTCFLRAGVPLRKYEHFRELLEENALRLTDRRHMTDLIPFVLSEEQQRIMQEISSKCVSAIFDGTSRLGEALAIVLRFISDDWTIEQRLVRVQLLAKSLSGEELAREIISIFSTSYSIECNRLLACIRDGAATNGVAVRTLHILYPNLFDVKCFSHTLDRVGEHFKIPVLNEFITTWISMFSHSPKARLCWRELTGCAMKSYSATRWWSKWEVMQQVMIQFGDVELFLTRYCDVAPTTNVKLQGFFQDQLKKVHLHLELASIIDWGENFVKATYILEGDGPLCLKCYEMIDMIHAAIASAHCPNVEAVAKKLTIETRLRESQMLQYAIQPGLNYFKSQMEGPLKDTLSAARLFSPQKAHTMQPRATDLDSLHSFPFFSDDHIERMKDELHVYLYKCADTDDAFCPLEWWRRNGEEIPNWSVAAHNVLLVQPSSAAAERAFSLLKASFHEQQDNSLQDYIESSLMLQFNSH